VAWRAAAEPDEQDRPGRNDRQGHGGEFGGRLFRDGYWALEGLWRGSDALSRWVRLAGRPALVVRGDDGARLFYNNALFRRHRAAPTFVANPLFGRGAVHGLDDAAHQQRKQVFLSVLTGAEIQRLVDEVERDWTDHVATWPGRGRIDVYQEAVWSLGASVIRWSGAHPPSNPRELVGDLAEMVDHFGSAAPKVAPARRRARRRAESWAATAVAASRLALTPGEPRRPVDVIASAVDVDGAPLDERTAAVELLNLLRPTVAVAWFVAFTAAVIADHPDLRAGLCTVTGTPADREAFAHELRRTCPFVPALAARARSEVTWQGHRLRRGQRLVLDVWSTNNLPSRWPQPAVFDLHRFTRNLHTAYDFIPQGGGDPAHGHRCPGEPVTIRIIEVCAQHLADLAFTMSPDDRTYPKTAIPTRPKARLIVHADA